MCVYCNRSHMTSQSCKEQKSTRRSRVAWLFFTRCDIFCGLLQYTHTRKGVTYLFSTIKIQMVYSSILWHEKSKTSPLTWLWRGLTSSACVSFNSHGQVSTNENAHRSTLLYKLKYRISLRCWTIYNFIPLSFQTVRLFSNNIMLIKLPLKVLTNSL